MAWAALAIPIVTSLLKGDEEQPAAPAAALPPPPSLGEVFASNQAKYGPTQHSYPTQSNPFSQFPIGGGSKSNG